MTVLILNDNQVHAANLLDYNIVIATYQFIQTQFSKHTKIAKAIKANSSQKRGL